MNTIAVILPINNPIILKQRDLAAYQKSHCFFYLHYLATPLQELNTAEDVDAVLPLMMRKINEAAENDAKAIIIYAFGEFGFEKKLQEQFSIPVITLGASSIRKASCISNKKFTIIPSMLSHNDFLIPLVQQLKLEKNNYQPAVYSPEISPAMIRLDNTMQRKLYKVAVKEIERGIDTITLGCGSFIHAAHPLQDALRKKFGESIVVVDPISTAFDSVLKIV